MVAPDAEVAVTVTSRIAVLIMAGIAGLPSPAAATSAVAANVRGPAVTVGTWNVCNHTCAHLDRRLRALQRTVAVTTPDVLALQEVEVRDGSFLQVERLLRGVGYAAADPGIAARCDGKCESHVFFRTATMDLAQSPTGSGPVLRGNVAVTALAPGARGNPAGYALLEHRASGALIMTVSLHMEKQFGTGGNGPDDRARNAAATGLAHWTSAQASRVGVPGVTTVLAGDYNSYLRKMPRGPQRVLQRLGFVDTDRAARTRLGNRFATVNKVPMDARWRGFPPRPRRFVSGGPRIDAILVRNGGAVLRHQVYVRVTRTGRFDEGYRASDHNLVLATMRLRP